MGIAEVEHPAKIRRAGVMDSLSAARQRNDLHNFTVEAFRSDDNISYEQSDSMKFQSLLFPRFSIR